MIRRLVSLAVISIITMTVVFAGAAESFTQADNLYDDEQYIEGFSLLENILPTLSSKQDKAACYWRMARFQLFIADDKDREGAAKSDLLEMYDIGSDFASEAIKLNPSADAYYWHSSNVGRWGEKKGILDSLAKAKPMYKDLSKVIEFDANYADAWYVLGRLYLLLPGWPLSFGNKTYAVSFTRRCLAVYDGDDLKITYYQSLAEALRKRDYSAKELRGKFSKMASSFKKGKDVIDKMKYYEGTLGSSFIPFYSKKALGQMSDREEAVQVLTWVINQYNALPHPSKGEKNDIAEVKELLQSWK